MAMTADAGRRIRKENSDIEAIPCAMYGLTMVTHNKSGTKVDGYSDTVKASIKASTLGSTQVHITSINKMSSMVPFSPDALAFIQSWFVSTRPPVTGTQGWEAMLNDMNTHKVAIISHILGVQDGINLIIWYNKTDKTAMDITVDKVLRMATRGEWVVGKRNGSFMFLSEKGKPMFHLQRHTNYAPQFHIKRNVMFI